MREPWVVRLASNGDYWQAWWWDDRGVRHRRGVGAKDRINRVSALLLVDEIRSELAAGAERRRNPTVASWCEEFLEFNTATWADATLELYTTTVRLLESIGGPLTITRDDAARWATSLHDDSRQASTVAAHVRRARAIFQAAADRDLIPFNPFDRVTVRVSHRIRPVIEIDEGDVERLIDAAPTPDFGILIALCAIAGLRRGEALRLNWPDVDFPRDRIIVRPKDSRRTTKSDYREVRLEPALAARLGSHPVTAERVVACSGSSLRRTMIATIERAELVPWPQPFHSLRRWRATTWRDRYPEHVVDSWLGHSLAVARQHYAAVAGHYFSGQDAPPLHDR